MVGFVEVTKEDKNDQNDREYASFIREKKEACGGKGRGTANTKSKKKNSCNGKAKKKMNLGGGVGWSTSTLI